MAAIYIMDAWNVEPIMSRPDHSPCKKEVAVYITVIDEEDEFLMETRHLRPAHVDMQRMIESALQVSQITTLDRHIKALIKTKAVSLLGTAKHEAAEAKNVCLPGCWEGCNPGHRSGSRYLRYRNEGQESCRVTTLLPIPHLESF